MLRKELFLPAELLPELEGINFYDHEVIDYKVIDESYGEVGMIKQIIDFKINPLIQIYQGEKEVLIPLIDGLVKSIDRKEKIMKIKAPDGLISLYLEGK